MILNYQTFYRKFGIRLFPQIAFPVLNDSKFLELPLESIYHHVTYDGVQSGPAVDDFLFRNNKRPIPVSSVIELTAHEGNPRKAGINAMSVVRDYIQSHRRMRILKSLDSATRDKQTLVVYNYSILTKTYKYPQSLFVRYYKWKNIFTTIIDTINSTFEHTSRQHFIPLSAPQFLPSVSQLTIAQKGINQTTLKVLKDNNAMVLLELWKWFSEDRHDSVFSKIPKNKLHLVNLLFQESGKWCVLNLGVLNSFYRPKEKEVNPEGQDYVIHSKIGIDGGQLGKRLIRMMMTIMEAKTLTAKIQEDVPTEEHPVNQDGVEIQGTSEVQDATVLDEDGDDEDDDVSAHAAMIDYVEPYKEQLADAIFTPAASLGDDLTSEMTPEEFAAHVKKEDLLLEETLSQLNEIAHQEQNAPTDAEGHPIYNLHEIIHSSTEIGPEDGVKRLCDKLSKDGAISAAEYKKFTKLAASYKEIKAVDGTPLEKFVEIPPQMLTLDEAKPVKDSSTVLDKTMLKSTLSVFDKKYVEEVLHRDYANTVLSVQKAGIAVTGYKVEKVEDVLGGYEAHTLKINPVIGMPSTIRFKLPIVNEDGTFVAQGTKYQLRKQRGDLPIRKVSPNKVALTSYYGKVFITRGRKNIDNYGYWLQTQVTAKALDKDDSHISGPVLADVFDHELHSPRTYSAVSAVLKSALVSGFELNFDHKEVLQTYPKDILVKYENNAHLVFGKSAIGGQYLIIDKTGSVYKTEDEQMQPLGSLEDFLGLETTSAPVEYATASVFGKDIPVGVILGLELGFEKLLGLLKVNPRRIETGQRANMTADEYALAFSDETLIFSKDNKLASMILAGFAEYYKTLKLFSVYSFNQRGVYVNLLEANGIGVRFVREIDLANSMFIDPITRDILIEMKEPTTYQGLLFRSCQMLLTDAHPKELDPAYMRIKGYERFSGAVYSELIQSIRAHNASLGRQNQPITMNPYAVWKRISEDPAKLQSSEINPIASLKEQEAVTYGGTGGRSRLSMTKSTRAYHKNDMGTISEATTDNSDVGINIYTSADPHFTSLRGMSKRFDFDNPNHTSLLSTSALLAPASSVDDQKRVNFVSIQQQHSVSCDGYHQFMVRTGYDSVLAHRTTDLYAFTAKKPGVVRQVTEHGIIVDNEDGSTQGCTLGRRFGNAQGLTVAHEIVTPLKAGDKVAVGDPIVYNSGFFEPDFFNPKQIVWKNALNVKTVLWESSQTHEDSSAISKGISQKLSTKITKVKTLVVNFDQTISELVKVGDQVVADTVLCLIEDAVTANNKLFNEESIHTLKTISAQAPRAHVKGVVEKIEVFYYGDKQDMSESLRELSSKADKELRQRALSVAKEPATGLVDGGFRIDNNGLALDQLAIKIYITSSVGAGVGD